MHVTLSIQDLASWSKLNLEMFTQESNNLDAAIQNPADKNQVLSLTPQHIEIISTYYNDKDKHNMYKFMHSHEVTDANWWPGLFPYHSERSLYSVLNYMANKFCRYRCKPLYTHIEKSRAIHSVINAEMHSGVPQVTKNNMAGKLVRTLRHMHPHNYESLVCCCLKTKDAAVIKEQLKASLHGEQVLHQQKMTNNEDGRYLQQILASDGIQDAMVKGMMKMGDDIVLLCWGGDWSNQFWFWFAWYGPGYNFLRNKESAAMSEDEVLQYFECAVNQDFDNKCEEFLKDIIYSWKNRLKLDAKTYNFDRQIVCQSAPTLLGSLLSEFLVRRKFWIFIAEEKYNYQYWRLTTWNMQWVK